MRNLVATPQRAALGAGLRHPPGDRPGPVPAGRGGLLLGVVVLDLLRTLTQERPRLRMVDDVQWLERAG